MTKSWPSLQTQRMNVAVWQYAFLTIFIFVSCAFIPAYFLRKNDLADVIWGPGFLVSALGGWYWGWPERGSDPRLLLAFSLIALWALRMAWHIGLRNFYQPEDVRYSNWRREWGRNWIWRSYLQVFLLQGVILFLINSPLLWILSHPAQPIDVFCILGPVVWLAGFLFEAIGDEQLRRFKSQPSHKGMIMTSGLWSWSRHPNYFGEVVQWWGIFLLALPLPSGFLSIISPIAITFFILKVSGVPMLEKMMENRPGAEEYRRNTSAFFPLPPKKK